MKLPVIQKLVFTILITYFMCSVLFLKNVVANFPLLHFYLSFLGFYNFGQNQIWHFCPGCNKRYSYRQNMLRHIKYECGKLASFQCPNCSYACKRKEYLKVHIALKH